MNESDVIESLKQKEEELDNLLNEARQKAFKIKQDAIHKAEEIKISMAKEVHTALDEYKKSEMEKIDKEAKTIEAEAVKMAGGLRLLADERFEEAVEAVVQHIVGGAR
ncbi:MAG: hypothetical protein HZB80_11900 [Deltaproteobacteria bacterium]|nr:hypothetical protein [Deltaproteobacteria bacterium]